VLARDLVLLAGRPLPALEDPDEHAREVVREVAEETVRQEVRRVQRDDQREPRHEPSVRPLGDRPQPPRGEEDGVDEHPVQAEEAPDPAAAELDHPRAVGDREVLAGERIVDAVATIPAPAEPAPLGGTLEELVLVEEAEPERERALLREALGGGHDAVGGEDVGRAQERERDHEEREGDRELDPGATPERDERERHEPVEDRPRALHEDEEAAQVEASGAGADARQQRELDAEPGAAHRERGDRRRQEEHRQGQPAVHEDHRPVAAAAHGHLEVGLHEAVGVVVTARAHADLEEGQQRVEERRGHEDPDEDAEVARAPVHRAAEEEGQVDRERVLHAGGEGVVGGRALDVQRPEDLLVGVQRVGHEGPRACEHEEQIDAPERPRGAQLPRSPQHAADEHPEGRDGLLVDGREQRRIDLDPLGQEEDRAEHQPGRRHHRSRREEGDDGDRQEEEEGDVREGVGLTAEHAPPLVSPRLRARPSSPRQHSRSRCSRCRSVPGSGASARGGMRGPSMIVWVTGGAGFIGSSFLTRYVPRRPERRFVNVDKLTYAANPLSLEPIASRDNYRLSRTDICDFSALDRLAVEEPPDIIVHFAAESHVDRSILGPSEFVRTNVEGTFNLLEIARKHWRPGRDAGAPGRVFHHVSTDEVYGSLGVTGLFTEETRYDPSSPYSSTKAASDHLVRAWARTYGLPVRITNCSNNYGPRQFPEKLVPLMILHLLARKPLPIYGKGLNVRDWLYVDDHADAIWAVLERGRDGETYNVGGHGEKTNLEVVETLARLVSEETGAPLEELLGLKTYVADRPGHDLRYAIDASKIERELGWRPAESFETGMRKTVRWYLENQAWVSAVQSGEYRTWIERNYGGR
jgi:dTDP-glucose 4,6-dehydratase